MHSAAKFVLHKLADDPDRWYPILTVAYLNYACDFRCHYCSDGAGKPYYALRNKTLPAARFLDLLSAVRRHTDYLVLTGGEPLLHSDFRAVMRGLPALRFKRVILTTNGYRAEPQLDVIAGAVQELVFSVDTLDRARADASFGVGDGALDRILGTIEAAAAHPKRAFEIYISSVVTPDNLDDLYGVCDWAWARGFWIAACPQLVGVTAHADLDGNPEYRRFYDFLLQEKRRGRPVHGTVPYLEAMRELRKFACRPFTMLVVSPTGDVFYPCLELGHFAGNLLETDDLHALRRAGRARFGPQPNCGRQCHSACALGFSVLLEQPQIAVQEAWLSKGHFARELARRATAKLRRPQV